jgi:ADP-heptose:LPS heptosyltransferase
MSAPRPRLLVARIGAIGDVCLLLPLVHALQRHFRIDWLIRDSHVAVVRAFPHVACELIGVSPAADAAQPFSAALVERLRTRRYAGLIDFSHWPSIAWLAGQLRDVPLRAVTLDPAQDALLGLRDAPPAAASVFNCRVPVEPGDHQMDKWRRLVRTATGVDAPIDWPLPAPRAASRDGVARVFVHAHASKPEKLWPARHFGAVLAGAARAHPMHCLLNGVRRRIRVPLQARLALSRATVEVVPLDASFAALRAALQTADLAFGCDSGPLQFAALLGVPTLILYGRYPAGEFAPLWRSTAVSPPAARQETAAIPPAQVHAALCAQLRQLGALG